MTPSLRLLVPAFVLTLVTNGKGDDYTILTEADAFVREQVPDGNYGGGGLNTVSGRDATNSVNEMNGPADAFLRFDMTGARAEIDAKFGQGQWTVVAASLDLVEVSNPGNPVFNTGAGQFQVWWMSADSWEEGAGTPNSPGATGINWNLRDLFLSDALDRPLGIFTNPNSGSEVSCSLALDSDFIADLTSDAQTSFYLTAATGKTGFNFRSGEYRNDPTLQPKLRLTVELLSPLQSWRKLWFGVASNTGAAADENDYDGDGIVNLLEWAFGLNPTSASSVPYSIARNAESLDFRYQRSNAAVQAGTAFTVEWSDTLSGPWSTEGAITTILSADGSFQQIQALLPAGSAGRRFVRLRVTAP